jgi:hypothetical protein
MWAKPTKTMLKRVPKLYATEGTPMAEKKVYLHFFIGGCDWYITEFDGEDIMFGFCNLGDDMNAEWGYVSLNELKQVKAGFVEVDTDKHWKVRPVKEVEEIVRCPSGVF